MNKINLILKEVLNEVKIPLGEMDEIKENLKKFLDSLNEKIKKHKISAEIFVGGSFAKETMMKKSCYDIDIFVRFDKKYENEKISGLTENLLKGIKGNFKVHGSRDYFRIKIKKNLIFEIIPVRKIKFPRESVNITDLSYSHVKYIRKNIKRKKKDLLDEILLAKAFCYANNCYGAESYVKGFSGYSIELLIYHYGSFLKFIKFIKNIKNKEVIDIEKYYKNKNSVLMDINAAKLQSPIILVDPTYKQRNVLAALSKETFEKFQKSCVDFLKSPNKDAFQLKKINFELIKEKSKKIKQEFILLEFETDKQEGDIAGSKLLKFYNHLSNEIEKKFCIKNKGFEYSGNKLAKCFFVVGKNKEITKIGPKIDDAKNLEKFKIKNKSTFIKENRIYSKNKFNISLSSFIKDWKEKNKEKIKAMYVKDLRILF